MGYDEIHNIVAKNQKAGRVRTSGGGNSGGGGPNVADIEGDSIQLDKKVSYDWAYDYGSSRPHAATHVGNRSFLYDLNGNLAGWDWKSAYVRPELDVQGTWTRKSDVERKDITSTCRRRLNLAEPFKRCSHPD